MSAGKARPASGVACRCFVESGSFPPQLLQHFRTQAMGAAPKGQQTTKRRSTLLLTPGSANAAPAAAVAGSDEPDLPDEWDLGVELLVQGKAEAAAQDLHKKAATAADAAQQANQRHMLLPQSISSRTHHQQAGQAGNPAISGCSTARHSATGGPPSQQRLLAHQESSCSSSSRSRSSFAGSVASYQQQMEAAQHQAQLLASASVDELQACRVGGLLWQWEELRRRLAK